tara:strand:+ start:1131 stop:1343 length:213 start_codon:yes stop_codon:yes gene_type:complete
MIEKCQGSWEPTEEQVDKIVLPAMQSIAKQCAEHVNELKCPPQFIAVMLRDIADIFENPSIEDESDCDCC